MYRRFLCIAEWWCSPSKECTAVHLSIRVLVDTRVVGLFWLFSIRLLVNIDVEALLWTCVFIFLGYISRSGVASLYGKCMFKTGFLKVSVWSIVIEGMG